MMSMMGQLDQSLGLTLYVKIIRQRLSNWVIYLALKIFSKVLTLAVESSKDNETKLIAHFTGLW